MDKEDVKEILCQQIKLLAEKSKEVKEDKDMRGATGALTDLSTAMCRLTDSYIDLSRNLNED